MTASNAYFPRLPPTLDQWQYHQAAKLGQVTTQPASALGSRFWQQHQLGDAIAYHGLAQLRPLLARLQRGEPVHVAAMGSSVVQAFGGCFQPSMEHLQAHVRRLPHAYQARQMFCHWRPSIGWLNNFMQVLNATWPHRNHTLFNVARGGQDLGAFIRHCVEDELPHRTDLFILENLDSRSAPQDIEALLWSIYYNAGQRGQPRPAVILLNSAIVCDLEGLSYECMKRASLCDTLCGQRADGTPGFRSTLHGQGPTQARELETARLAQHYGVTMLSERQWLTTLLHSGFHTARNWSECVFLTQTHADWIHPSSLGQVLLADLLLHVVRLAEEHAAAHPLAPPPALPAEALFPPGGHTLWLSRCYITDEARYDEIGPEFTNMPEESGHGWRMMALYKGLKGFATYKPGFYAQEAGAALALRVNTTFPAEGPEAAAPNTTRIVVTYMKSYERMGVALASCSGDCACASVELDGHHMAKVSLRAIAELRLSHVSGPNCTLALHMATHTSSGGHRFKLEVVAVAAQRAHAGQGVSFRFPPGS